MDLAEPGFVGRPAPEGGGLKLRFYSEFTTYNPGHRYHVNNLAKAYWNDRTNEERKQVYGEWVELFEYEPDITKADLCLLTYYWNYYVDHNRVFEAESEVRAAKAAGKPMVVFHGGAFPANVPFEDVILFESAGYRSTPGLRYHSAQPSYIDDYLHTYCGGNLNLREKREVPVIGFCGQASNSPFETAYRNFRLKERQKQYRQGKLKWEPPPFETTSFRSRVLKSFEKPGLKTNYLARKKYKAGKSKTMTPDSQEKLDFVSNILESDYTVCMRGGGNFSVRFYETLCLGRIPIFIDSDCLLPFQDEIDYKAIFPWIDINDLPHAAEIVLDFHKKLSSEEFIALQKMCRYLWGEHMMPDGFYKDFVKKMQSQ